MAKPEISSAGLASLIDQVGRTTYGLGYTDGLNPAQWGALRYFARAAARARTVKDFVRFQGTTQGTASRTVAALVEKGLLSKAEDPEDRRRTIVTCTAQGTALLAKDPLDLLAEVLSALPQERQLALAEILEQVLYGMFEQRNRVRRQSMAAAD